LAKFIVSLDLGKHHPGHPSIVLLKAWNATALQNSLWLVEHDDGIMSLSTALSAVLSPQDGLFVHPFMQMIHRASGRENGAAVAKSRHSDKRGHGRSSDARQVIGASRIVAV